MRMEVAEGGAEPEPEPEPWLACSPPLGFDDTALQFFAPRTAGEDGAVPPPLAAFGGLGLLSHPHVWCYDSDGSFPFLPLILVQHRDGSTLPGPSAAEAAVTAAIAAAQGDSPWTVKRFSLLHRAYVSAPCAKLICENTDEFSLMWHSWLFAADGQGDESVDREGTVLVGLFDADGVQPTHLDLSDGGMPFGCLEARTVVVHNYGALSPANCQVRLVATRPSLVRFTSVAVHAETQRAVITTHWLPTTEDAEGAAMLPLQRERGVAEGCRSLAGVVKALQVAEEQGAPLLGLVAALRRC